METGDSTLVTSSCTFERANDGLQSEEGTSTTFIKSTVRSYRTKPTKRMAYGISTKMHLHTKSDADKNISVNRQLEDDGTKSVPKDYANDDASMAMDVSDLLPQQDNEELDLEGMTKSKAVNLDDDGFVCSDNEYHFMENTNESHKDFDSVGGGSNIGDEDNNSNSLNHPKDGCLDGHNANDEENQSDVSDNEFKVGFSVEDEKEEVGKEISRRTKKKFSPYSNDLSRDIAKEDEQEIINDKLEESAEDENERGMYDHKDDKQINHSSQLAPSDGNVDTYDNSKDVSRNDIENKDAKDINNRNESFMTENKSETQPNDSDLFSAVDLLYSQADQKSVTDGDIIRSVESMFEVKLRKKNRKKVRMRLTDLINGEVNPEEVDTELLESDNNNDESLDANENIIAAKKSESKSKSKKKKTRTKKSIRKANSSDMSEGEGGGYKSDTEEEEAEQKPISPMTRSKTSSSKKKKRIPSHVRIHAEMVRKKQLAEAKVRAEELRAKREHTINEKDAERARQIAQKFDTNSEQAKIKRVEDRLDLLQRLEERRMALLVLREKDETKQETEKSLFEDFGMSEKDVVVNNKDDSRKNLDLVPRLTVDSKLATDNSLADQGMSRNEGKGDSEMVEDGGTDNSIGSSGIDSESSSDEELEILPIHPKEIEKVPSPTSILNFVGVKIPVGNKRVKKIVNTRVALRNALRAKQYQAGNNWLARELGYDTQEDHIKACQMIEIEKRKQVIKKEEQRRLIAQQRQQNLQETLLKEQQYENNDDENIQDDDKEIKHRTLVTDEGVSDEENNIDDEDEEMALAREIEAEQNEEIEENQKDDMGVITKPVGNSLQDDFNTQDDNEIASDKSINKIASVNGTDSEIKTTSSETVEMGVILKPVGNSIEDNSYTMDDNPHNSDIAISKIATVNGSDSEIKTSKFNNSFSSTTQNVIEMVSVDAVSNFTTDAAIFEESNDKEDPEMSKGNDSENVGGENEFDDNNDNVTNKKSNGNSINTEEDTNIDKKPRNAAWQQILKKEAEVLKKQKANRNKYGLVDAEAEEEEEEEGVAGLEDFGFTVQQKAKGDDDEEEDEVNEEDFENVVDDVSDNEGDEDAGEEARKAMDAKEEKMRHKEILRRMREGYDGRRRGVAGGSGARGNLRFDDLVAADNRKTAKLLGLLNDDELDSDDEIGDNDKNDDEVEDEAVLLDKMLKDRHLNKFGLPEENFSEEEEAEEEETGSGKDDSDDEEYEQDRLAKRFAKRARMNRLLDTYSGDSQFSQLRLLDEDESLKKDLRNIRNVHNKRMRQTSTGSSFSGISRDNSSTNMSSSAPEDKRQSTDDNNRENSASSIGSLSVALLANRQFRKRKTTFLGGKRNNGSRRTCSSQGKGVSLGHVLFQTGDSQNQNSQLSRSISLSSNEKSFRKIPAMEHSFKRHKSLTESNTLWNKVSANGFRKR